MSKSMPNTILVGYTGLNLILTACGLKDHLLKTIISLGWLSKNISPNFFVSGVFHKVVLFNEL
jgi:hypothetical protein